MKRKVESQLAGLGCEKSRSSKQNLNREERALRSVIRSGLL